MNAFKNSKIYEAELSDGQFLKMEEREIIGSPMKGQDPVMASKLARINLCCLVDWQPYSREWKGLKLVAVWKLTNLFKVHN